jgi:TPR repeat protein
VLVGATFLTASVSGTTQSDPAMQAEDQINRALAHCPQLQKIVWRGNPIWTWLTQAFDSSGLGFTTIFDTRPVSMEHTTSESGALSPELFYVRVNPTYVEGAGAGQERTSEEVLCNLVFELNNLRLFRDHEIIDHLARCGEIRREAYIYDSAQEEYFALKMTSEFYNTIWIAFCTQNKIKENPAVWRLPLEPTFAERLAKYPKSSWYPWKLFGSRYDQENSGMAHPVTLQTLNSEELQEVMKKAVAGDSRAEERVGIAFLSRETGSSRTNDNQSFVWMSKAATQGDVLSQLHLEWMYRVGIGVQEDQTKSFNWNLKAADQGDALAEFLLGVHYEEGEGVAKNDGEAMRWFQKSADQGYGEAEDSVGYALIEGTGVAKNPQKALDYFLKAAPSNAHASYVLASCYAQGAYVKQDLVQAYKWCLISLSMDSQAYGLGEQLRKQLSDTQIKRAERDAVANATGKPTEPSSPN